MASGFDPFKVQVRHQPAWVTLEGRVPLPASHVPSAEEVLGGGVQFDIKDLPLCDPRYFVPGQLHECIPGWEDIIDSEFGNVDVLKWIKHGVDIHEFFHHFKGNFKGKHFDSDVPPKQYFKNASSCKQHVEFITRELCEKIASGSIRILGKVGCCQPPKVIMPLIVGPSKPRLCHDERFINFWIKDFPFMLKTLKDIHRMVQKKSFIATCDEKSGYDYIRLNESSRTYFEIQFGGYLMVYNTLPFGWKASPFIYQSVGMCVTVYLRRFAL